MADGVANRGIGKEKGLIEASKDIQESGPIILVVAVGQFSDHQLKKMVHSDNIYRTTGDKDEFTALIEHEFVLKVKEAICGSIKPEKGLFKQKLCPLNKLFNRRDDLASNSLLHSERKIFSF